MKNTDQFDFNEALSIEQYYIPDRFFEPFFVFASRFDSLARFYHFTDRHVGEYLRQSRASYERVNASGPAEDVLVHGEMTIGDEAYFREYIHASVLSQLFSLLETLMQEVADYVAGILGIELPTAEQKMPYVNRYIRYLTQGCGLSIQIDKDTWKKLDLIRELRNRYIHRITRELPEAIRGQMREITQVEKDDYVVDSELVKIAFATIAGIAGSIDHAYWAFYDSHKS